MKRSVLLLSFTAIAGLSAPFIASAYDNSTSMNYQQEYRYEPGMQPRNLNDQYNPATGGVAPYQVHSRQEPVRAYQPGADDAQQAAATSDNSQFPVISGGIGSESQQYIKAHEGEYNLKMTLTGQAGIYLSDVNVVIRNASGDVVVNTTTEGPLVLTKLPSGTYKVEATAEGNTRTQTVNVPKNGMRSYVLRFDNIVG